MVGLEMIVLDTHVWLWWVSSPELLSTRAVLAIKKAISDHDIYISSISAWEIALLVRKERLILSIDVQDWIMKTESLPFVNFIPVDNNIAVKSVSLPRLIHDDPADRIIIASTMINNGALITKDKKILSYKPVQTIW